MEPTNSTNWKGKSSEPHLHDFGFQPLIFRVQHQLFQSWASCPFHPFTLHLLCRGGLDAATAPDLRWVWYVSMYTHIILEVYQLYVYIYIIIYIYYIMDG